MSATSPLFPRPRPLFWGVTAGALALDQLSKFLVERNMFEGLSREIIPGFFNLTYVRNEGVAFGNFQHLGNLPVGLMAFAILIFAAWWSRSLNWKGREVNIVAALITAGAIGNLIDRLRVGAVIDFLDFYLPGIRWHWPAFNFADSFITCSVVYIIIRIWFDKEPVSDAPHERP